VIKQWVSEGGSLFLIADHIPFPKVAESLSLAFGFEFSNGHVDTATFRIDDGSLAQHRITKPMNSGEQSNNESDIYNGLIEPVTKPIRQVRTFGGSAQRAVLVLA
jgi:hypothetical protein